MSASDMLVPPPVARRPTIMVSIHGPGLGGAELLGIEAVKELSETFAVVAATPRPDTVPDAVATVPGPRSMPLWGASASRWIKCCLATVIDSWRLVRAIRRHGVRLVLVNSSVSLSPVIAARLCRVPCVVHVRDWPHSKLAPAVLWLHAALADELILICQAMVPMFPGWLPARRRIIYEGIDVDIENPRAVGDATSAGDPLRLLLVGGIDPRKGQDVAIKAVDRLRRRGLDVRLRLVGREVDQVFARELRILIADLGLGEHVIFAGEISPVQAIYRDGDAVIVPSRGEWTPLVLMEALIRGLPVIGSDIGGVGEMLGGGRFGLLVPAGDPVGLADAIEAVAAGGESISAMCRAGRGEAERKFDRVRSMRELRGLLMQLTGVNR